MGGDWVSELEAFQPSGDGLGQGNQISGNSIQGPPNQLEELTQEMKLLHWHKLANEAALKAALIRTRKHKSQDRNATVMDAVQEKAEWMQQIVEEEQSKPLEVDSEYLKEYEKQERREEERLQEEVRRHIRSLRALRSDLKKREETRKRNMKYKMERAAFQMKQSSSEDETGLDSEEKETRKQPVTGTLSKVIHSLDKLVELEKRISHLEEDTGPANTMFGNRTSLQFAKKHTNTSDTAPSKTYFAMKVRQDPRSRRGNHLPRLPPRGHLADDGKSISSVPQVQRNRRQAPIRVRRNDDKTSANQQHPQRQDIVINDWLKKKEGASGCRAAGVARNRPGQRVSVGAASGKRANNLHMQQFHDIRQQFEKKKDALARNVQAPVPGRSTAQGKSRIAKRRLAWEERKTQTSVQQPRMGVGSRQQKQTGKNKLPRIGQRTAW